MSDAYTRGAGYKMETIESKSEMKRQKALRESDLDAQENGVKRWRCNCIPVPRQVLAESDHDRVVAEKDESYDKLDNVNMKLNETIAAQSLVIEKLKEQRDNLAHDAAYEINYGPHPKEALEKIKELDAELAALTKQPEPKEGV